jgi:dihydroflavonol-4-reductase
VKAFVTGATGFVGSAVVRKLLQRGMAVKVLARPASNLQNVAGLGIELVLGDLLDEDGLTSALSDCGVLYHVAAFYSTAEADSQKVYEINVRGTKTVLRAALRAGVQRAVHTSTIGTIGQPTDGSLATEETPFNLWDTASHYAKSKYLGEVAALTMCQSGLPVVVVNPCAPVGPRDLKPSSTGHRILDYLHSKIPSFVPGGINFVSVDDVAEGHVLAAEKGRVGERYILGQRDGNLLLSDFMAIMERVSGVQRPPATGLHKLMAPWSILSRQRASPERSRREKGDHRQERDFRPLSLTCDPAKAIAELGLPQTPLDTAFSAAIAWFKENGYVGAKKS